MEKRRLRNAKPWLKWDIMKSYRETVNEDEAEEIMKEVFVNTNSGSKQRAKRLKATLLKKAN